MSRTGRPRAAIPRLEWKVYIRADLAAQVELLLADPMRDKVKYGARGQLLESLLETWLATQRTRSAKQLDVLKEPSELARFLNALQFECSNWSLATPDKIKELVRAEKAKISE